MKNVVIVSSSLRVNSSSKQLTLKVIEGIKENNEVDFIDLSTMNLSFCRGCLSCQKTGKCIIKDDVNNYLDLISNADIIVFATPIYYYSISGQMKTFLDRLNPLYIKNNKFKSVYAIYTCADTNIDAINGPKEAIEGWVCCFDGVKFIDSFNGLGINEPSDLTDEIKNNAYIFGKSIK